jgi:hypothetical protein
MPQITLEYIAAQLNAVIDPDTRTLTLPASVDLGAPILALFKDYLLGGPLVMKDALVTMQESQNRVLLTGTGTSFPLDTLTVRAYWSVADGGNSAAVDLIGNAGDDWKVNVAFPKLSGTFFPDLSFASAALILRSVETGDGPPGLYFACVLKIEGNLSYLVALLSGTTEVEMSSPIVLTGDIPNMTLSANYPIPTPGIGSFAPFHVRLTADSRADFENVLTAFRLEGVLTYGDGQELAIGYDLLNTIPQLYHFVADLSKAGLSFANLTALLNGSDPTPVLPPVFSVLNNFEFKRWEIYIATGTFSVADVLISVGTVKPWELLPDHLLDLNIDAFTVDVQNFTKLQVDCELNASFILGQPEKPARIALQARFPGFQFRGQLVEGELDIPYMVGRYIGPAAAALVPSVLVIKQLALSVDPPSSSFSFYITTEIDWKIDIGVGSFTVREVSFALSRVAQATSGQFKGKFRLGTIEPAILVDVTAGYSTVDGWKFEGGLSAGSKVSFVDILNSYFPSWNLDGMTLDLELFRVEYTQKTSSYRFQIRVLWALEFPGWSSSLTGESDLAYDGTTQAYKGFVSGSLVIEGFELSARVDYPSKTVTLNLGGLQVQIAGTPVTFTISFPNITVGDIIAMLVGAAIGENVTLPAPWNLLNLIKLSDLKLIITPGTKVFKAEYSPKINLGFVSIDTFVLSYTGGQGSSGSKVELSIVAGSFLGQPIDPADPVKMNVLDPASAPKVPGAGDAVFALHFLAIGQRVVPKTPIVAKTVTQALNDLEKAFYKKEKESGSPVTGTELVPSERTSWIFAVRAEILSAITIRALFLDPDLYGVGINVGGTRFPKFTGLNFEILYKQINENVGVYQLELKLPDVMRQFEFGAVSITLPIIAIEIYTNGDFLIDIGFPANGDFTRSFAIQVLPFTGAGGFYFGVLSNATAKRLPPPPLCGSFSPVIVAGLGLRIGLGKDINKGILKAGLSLTVTGIVEGMLAFYNDDKRNPQYDSAVYYYLSGQVSIVGQLYGEINFAIISARLDVLIKIGVTFQMAALDPLVFGFFAEIRVSLTIKINLGIFNISISLAFSATIQESFTIGSPSPKPWYNCQAPLPEANSRLRRRALDAPLGFAEEVKLVFNPVTRPLAQEVRIWFVPQFTPASQISGGQPQPARAQCVVTFNVETSIGNAAPVQSEFDKLARGFLLWTLRAYLFPEQAETPEADVLAHEIKLTDLDNIYGKLSQPGADAPFDEKQLLDFFAAYFKLIVSLAEKDPKESQVFTTIFPVLTPLILALPDGKEIPFAAWQEVSRDYLKSVKDYFKLTQVDNRTGAARFENPPQQVFAAGDKSLACWMMLDYFTLIAKDATQAAIDTMTGMTVVAEEGDSIAKILARWPKSNVSVEDVAWANATSLLFSGARLAVRNSEAYQVNQSGPATLFAIARHYNLPLSELARTNADTPGIFPAGKRVRLPRVESTTVSALLDAMQEHSAFEHLAGSAARVLLYGLRPPAPADGPLTPLYELNGQQFDASTLVAGSKFSLKLGSVLDWLVLIAPVGSPEPLPIQPVLPVTVSQKEAEVITAFNGAKLDPQITSLEPMALYRTRPKSFGLGNAVVWRPGSNDVLPLHRTNVAVPGDWSIWALPSTLQTLLFENPDLNPLLDAYEAIQKEETQPPTPVKIEPADYVWAARVDITVRRVRNVGDAIVANTYEMLGTNVAGSAVLQFLLSYSKPDPVHDIHVLYPGDPLGDFAGLLSRPVTGTSIFLLQTNLSTEANPELLARNQVDGADTPYLIGMTPVDFLKYVWEGSIVRSGGYYFYYRDEGGEGLPDYLFNDTEETLVTLLVTMNPLSPGLKPYVNSLVLMRDINTQDTALYLAADPAVDNPLLEERAPTVPPGCSGFVIERVPPVTPPLPPDMAITPEAAAPFVAELYNLLNYQVADFGGFHASPFAMPASPADSVDPDPDPNADRRPRLTTKNWHYEAVVPLYRFAGAAPLSFTEPLPDPGENPYQGVGTDAGFDISWLDLFGNRIQNSTTGPVPSLKVPVRYFDNLLPVDKWPSVSTDYFVTKDADGAALDITLGFHASRYLPPPGGGEDYKSVAEADLPTWELIYYQLTQPGMNAFASSTFDSKPAPCLAALVEYAISIYQFLYGVVHGPAGTIPVDKKIRLQPQDTNPDQYYQVLVSITIQRPAALVDERLSGQVVFDPVREVSSFVPANYVETPTNDIADQPLTLRAFAAGVEQAFPNLVVATSAPRVSWNAENGKKEIWVVRFGGTNGIVFDVKKPAVYFAPLPLSRALRSAQYDIYPYQTGVPIDEGVPQVQSFAGVDMDLLAATFLNAVDLVLSPQFVTPAWLALNAKSPGAGTPNAIEQILVRKKELAGLISARIGIVLKEQTASPQAVEAAAEKLRQQLLIRLGALFTVDSIVQFRSEVTSQFDDPETAPRIFGNPGPVSLPTSSATQDYSFSTAEVSLNNQADSSFLTFLLRTRDPSQARNVTLDMVYRRSNLQFGFSTIPGIPDYEASSWMAFVLQNGITELGEVTAPIPLRAYPPPPVLIGQSAAVPKPVPLAPGGNPALAEAKRWAFEFAYDYAAAEQDTVYSDVQFNVPGGSGPALARGAQTLDLLGALLQFSSVSPALLRDLESSLITAPDSTLAVTSLNSLAWLVGIVSEAWSGFGPKPRGLFVAPTVLNAKLRITQAPLTIKDVEYPVFSVAVECTTDGRPLSPTVELAGFESEPPPQPQANAGTIGTWVYVDSEGEYLSYQAGIAIRERSIRFSSMNLLAEQTGWGGLYIRRNEVLVPGKETNPEFVYETPDLRFASVLTPVLRPKTDIDVAASSDEPPTADELYNYLRNFLADFFDHPPSPGGTIKLGGNFVYDLNNGSGVVLPIALPVFLTLPTELTTGTAVAPQVTVDDFSRSLANDVVSWFSGRELTGKTGRLTFHLSLYSALAGGNLPILELENIYLETELIW